MNNELCIERLKENDLSVLVNLIENTIETSFKGFYSPEEIENAIASFNKEYLRRESYDREFYVGKINNEMISCISMVKDKFEAGYSRIAMVFVQPRYQQKGIGSAMVDFVEKRSLEIELNKVKLYSTNLARPFYEKMGYIFLEKEIDSKLGEMHIMEKTLAE